MARGAKARVYIDADASGVARGTRQAEAALKRLDRTGSRSLRSLSREARGIAPRLAGAAAGFTSIAGAAALLKDSVDQTMALAKGTALLSRTTGESTQEASRWVAIAKVRGVEVTKLNRSFVQLSKAIVAANDGSEKQAKLFKQLGVTQAELAKGDVSAIMGDIADAFDRMPDGAQKAAAAQQLFGRNAASLLPLLNKGSQALRDQLALSDKYGTTLSRKQVAESLRAAQAQRELNLAMLGLKVQLGQAVIPALTAGVTKLTAFVAQMRSGEGAGGRFAAKVREVWQNIQPTVTAIGRMAAAVGRFVAEHPGVQRMLAVLIPVGAALKVAGGASTVAGLTRLAGSLRSVGTAGKGAAVGAAALSNIHLAAWFAGALVTARNLSKSGIDPLNSKTITFRRALDFADRQGGAFLRTIGRIVPGMRQMGDMLHRVNQEVQGNLGKVRQYGRTWRDVANDIALVGQAITDLPSIPELSPNYPGTNVPQVPRGPGRRRGGMVWRAGGLVPSLLSPGEMVIPPGGGAHIVPGAPRAADSVPMMLPSGSAVLTWSGQDLLARGASLGQAVAAQAPHFRAGGKVPFEAAGYGNHKHGAGLAVRQFSTFGKKIGRGSGTAYGPPWNAMEGSGITSSGVKLSQGVQKYVVATDPGVIARHTPLNIWPNPFGQKNLVFWAEDTGGAIDGTDIDFFVASGRSAQNAWGRRSVDIYRAGNWSGSSGSGGGGSRAARTVRWQTYQPPGRTTGRVSRAAWEAGWQSGLSDPFGYGRAQERTDDYNTARARLFGTWTSHSRTIPARRAPTQRPSAGGTGRAAKVVRWAKNQLGYHEGPGNQNRYGPSAPWCGYFVQAGLKSAGLNISRGMGYVPDIRNMISAGAAPFAGPVSAGAMQPGDVITWGGHTGFYIGGGKAISGNYGDAVREHGSTAPGGIVKAGRPRYRRGGWARFRSGGVALGSVGASYGQDIYGRPWRAGQPVLPPSTRQQAYSSLWAMLNPGIGRGTEGAVKSAFARAQKVIDRLPYGDLRVFIADAQRIRRRSFGGPKVTQTMQSRVQQVIDYAGGALARVISRPVGVSDSVQAAIGNEEGVFDDQLTLGGIAPESREGIAKRIEFNNKSIVRLWKRKAALKQALARLKRVKPPGWKAQAKQITDEISEIDRQVIGLAAANTRLRKEMLTALPNAQVQAGETAAAEPAGISADAQAQIDQANVARTVAQRSANLSEAFIRTAFGSGDIGSGSQWAWTSAGGSGAAFGPRMSITINTLHPGDSQTLAAIANAATAGMGQQGFVTSPRAASGV